MKIVIDDVLILNKDNVCCFFLRWCLVVFIYFFSHLDYSFLVISSSDIWGVFDND